MKKSRISEAIQNIDPKFVDEANSYTKKKTSNRLAWIKFGAIAACLCIVAAVFAVPLFKSSSTEIAVLESGEEIKFIKTDSASAQFDSAFRISTKELTEAEITALFKDLPVTGYALLNEEDGSVLGIQGSYKNMKLLISAPGINISDTVIVGEETASNVNGVKVKAGYFTTNKAVIYYAAFKLGESTVYLENAGNKDESENAKTEIASAVQSLTLLKDFNINIIAK